MNHGLIDVPFCNIMFEHIERMNVVILIKLLHQPELMDQKPGAHSGYYRVVIIEDKSVENSDFTFISFTVAFHV